MESVAASTRCTDASLTLADFQFDLPSELIAQVPAERRDQARLLVLDRATGALTHTQVHALPDHLQPGDLLVVNDTRVIPARLFGRTASGGAVEMLLIRALTPAGPCPESPGGRPSIRRQKRAATQGERLDEYSPQISPLTLSRRHLSRGRLEGCPLGNGLLGQSPPRETDKESWLCLGKPANRLRAGTGLIFPDSVGATVVAVHGNGHYRVTFDDAAAVPTLIARHGDLPLPPYIRRPDGPLPLDHTRYQTIFATTPGAIAAPTAALHFTDALLSALRAGGVETVSLTLHVGPGTFLPVRCEDLRRHVMAPEWCDIPATTGERIRAAKATGRRVVAVGTTTTRALESAASHGTIVEAGARWADQFIVPGHQFRVVDALLTNFHLPASTLLLLVSAFAGRERVLRTYAEAIRRRYRFYSYGDAMLIQ